MNVVRNIETSKYNIVDCLKTHNLYTFFARVTLEPHTWCSALHADRHLCYYWTYDLCVGNLHLPIPRTDLGGGRMLLHSAHWLEENNASAKNHA